MGLFNLFNKKNKNEAPKNSPAATNPVSAPASTPKSEFYTAISRYNEYIVRYLGMQQQGNYAPIAAYEKPNGELTGFLYVLGADESYFLSAGEVISRMEHAYEQKLAAGEIRSYAILYHSTYANDDNHALANSEEEFKAISIAYHFKDAEKGKIGLPYRFEDDSITYQGIRRFSKEENNELFATELVPSKDYFTDREEIVPPQYENEAGLIIKQTNAYDLNNTWCGILGFERYRAPNGSQVVMEHFALALQTAPVATKNHLTINQLEYDAVILKGISVDEKPASIVPVIKTDYTMDIENKEIREWENVENLYAYISGGGRNTFGLAYLATDYAENRDRYLASKEHQIRISGIAFVLDHYSKDASDSEGELQYSEDFTAYMPNNDLPNQACFDFIGQLEDFRETTLLENGSQKAYLMKVRLITNPDIKDFFTIDMYATPENMRFSGLTVGMKLTGMVQLQGCMAEE
jgi:hypothetical protein